MLLIVSGGALTGCLSGAIHDAPLCRQLQRMGTGAVLVSIETTLPGESGEAWRHEVIDNLDVVAVVRGSSGSLARGLEWAAARWAVDAIVGLCEVTASDVAQLTESARSISAGLALTATPSSSPEAVRALAESCDVVITWTERASAPAEGSLDRAPRVAVVCPGADPRWTSRAKGDSAHLGHDGGLLAVGRDMDAVSREALTARGIPVHDLRDCSDAASLLDRCGALLIATVDVDSFHFAQIAKAAGIHVVMPTAEGLPAASTRERTFTPGDWDAGAALLREAASDRDAPPLPPRIEEEAFLLEKALEAVARRA